MTIRISLAIPNSASGRGKLNLGLPNDVPADVAGEILANTLRSLRDEAGASDKGIVRFAEGVLGHVDTGADVLREAIKSGKLDKDGYPPVDFSGVTK